MTSECQICQVEASTRVQLRETDEYGAVCGECYERVVEGDAETPRYTTPLLVLLVLMVLGWRAWGVHGMLLTLTVIGGIVMIYWQRENLTAEEGSA